MSEIYDRKRLLQYLYEKVRMKLQTPTFQHLNVFTGVILSSAITVHKEMGPGLLESVYQHCLIKELRNQKLAIEASVSVPLTYRGEYLNKDYVIDLLVEKGRGFYSSCS